MNHPYIGMFANANGYDGLIVYIGGDDFVTVMTPDGQHKTTRLWNLKVDPTDATARLTGKSEPCPPLAPATIA